MTRVFAQASLIIEVQSHQTGALYIRREALRRELFNQRSNHQSPDSEFLLYAMSRHNRCCLFPPLSEASSWKCHDYSVHLAAGRSTDATLLLLLLRPSSHHRIMASYIHPWQHPFAPTPCIPATGNRAEATVLRNARVSGWPYANCPCLDALFHQSLPGCQSALAVKTPTGDD